MSVLDISSYALGLATSLSVMGLLWLAFDIRRVLRDRADLFKAPGVSEWKDAN
jgi:hypothetical protein